MIEVIRASHQEQELTLLEEIPIRDAKRPFYLTLVICLSTLFSGCSLTIISASSLNGLIQYYGIDLSTQSTLSLLNGVLPAGGMLGAILLPSLVTLTTKKKMIYFLALASLVVCALSLLPHLFIFVLSRFILGILNGFHMSLASAFIKEIFPSHIRKPLGAVYSTARIMGMLTCYLIAEVSGYTLTEADHIITFMGPAFISVLQSFLFWWFMPDSIVEMIAKKNEQEAKRGLTILYSPELVDRRYRQMRMEISAAIQRTVSFQKIRLLNRKNLCSLHLAMLRQFCGQTYIVIYAREIMKSMDSPYANVTPAIVNSIQLLAGLVGIVVVQKVSRSKLLVSSCCLLALLNVGIGLTDLYDMPIYCLLAMTLFMIPNGIGLSSVAWSYPSELVPASQGKYSSFLNWTCSTMVAMVPPYIVKSTPNEGAYPVFLFFAFYLIVAFLINLSLLSKISRPKDESEHTLLTQNKE